MKSYCVTNINISNNKIVIQNIVKTTIPFSQERKNFLLKSDKQKFCFIKRVFWPTAWLGNQPSDEHIRWWKSFMQLAKKILTAYFWWYGTIQDYPHLTHHQMLLSHSTWQGASLKNNYISAQHCLQCLRSLLGLLVHAICISWNQQHAWKRSLWNIVNIKSNTSYWYPTWLKQWPWCLHHMDIADWNVNPALIPAIDLCGLRIHITRWLHHTML